MVDNQNFQICRSLPANFLKESHNSTNVNLIWVFFVFRAFFVPCHTFRFSKSFETLTKHSKNIIWKQIITIQHMIEMTPQSWLFYLFMVYIVLSYLFCWPALDHPLDLVIQMLFDSTLWSLQHFAYWYLHH